MPSKLANLTGACLILSTSAFVVCPSRHHPQQLQFAGVKLPGTQPHQQQQSRLGVDLHRGSALMSGEAELIDGKAIAASIRLELKEQVDEFKEKSGITPGLAVVLVGDRRDSATYVRMKRKACEEIGVASFGFDYASDVTQAELLRCVAELNARADVHGILVQLPLPPHIDESAVLDSILPEKDVDGLHPMNVAALSMGHTRPGQRPSWSFADLDFHVPCTPQGCIELLDRSGVAIEGKSAAVLGRSNIVGIPVAMLLMHRHATVTVVHSRTANAAEVVRAADIVVTAVGKAELVKGDWIKPGAVVIDVGINSVDDATKKAGYRLVGDVDFAEAKLKASKITPVPGGVGPMTIAMLLRNTVAGAARMHTAAAAAAAAASASGANGAEPAEPAIAA
eukprot:TRINITY_DN78_c0_g1_i4.p1 TRINITY_DN78_c0_g1~~TRINITY_DN78_c0_g1_i4.p1  ORF type:complete len:395 (-),score=125.40 TRINITY_DN78_c0_g1_i4:153-1337(-)